MNLWDKVIKYRLKIITTVSENQFGFMSGRSTMIPIYLLRRLIENGRDLHMFF